MGEEQTITHDIPPDIVLDGYPVLLTQVVLHLIDNAVRHGFEGRAAGRIHLCARTPETGCLELRVEDDGIGIPPENLGRIFDPFFTTKMGRGGRGIGLCTDHNIVTVALGGSITAESLPGRGCTFILRLPTIAPGSDRKAS